MKFAIKILITISIFFIAIFLTFFILDKAYPLNLNMLYKPQSKIIKDSSDKTLYMQISSDEIWRFKANSDEIPKDLKLSTIYFEDRYFRYHFGINPFSIVRAFIHNLANNNRIGASTITMQVARMMNPKSRNYTNKLLEIFNAFQLEWHFSKDEILTMYFNLAPYGGNIEGVKAASYFYFNKKLKELTISQMALLSTIPKNPNKNRLDRASNANSIKNRVLKELFDNNIIDESSHERAKKEKFIPKRFDAIKKAEIYSNIALKNDLNSTKLNLDFQEKMVDFLKKYMISLKDKSVKNASAIIIDNKNMQVITYVNSHDKFAQNGQNDGVASAKNVGSTLKPFIYSLALDNGLITPKKELIDTEIYLNEYIPQNYNFKFVGVINASDALGFSLNIPAVKLNNILKENSLFELLKRANLVEYEKEYYGDSIALGGISLSLLDLTHLYTIYANNGVLKSLELAGNIIDKNESLLTPQSAYLTIKMLQNAPRSYLNSVWKNTLNKPKIMFKTGTSAGARDLYTIGVSSKYTIGVWMGNFSGAKTDELSGGMSAAKVVFDMFEYIDKKEGIDDFKMPNGIVKDKICVDVYEIKNSCKTLMQDYLIEGVELKESCNFYRNEELFFLINSGYLDKNDIKNSKCYFKFKDVKPLISNLDKKIISLNDKNVRVGVKCTAILGDKIYMKFDNENFEKHNNSETIFKTFDIGEHEISCLDEYSNLSKFKFNVVRFKQDRY